jgi:hypothetical protein
MAKLETQSVKSKQSIKRKLYWILGKSVPQLHTLWIFCPWLRSDLAQVLSLLSEHDLRSKQHKVLKAFLEREDNVNVEFMSRLLLFDSAELFTDDVTTGLYHSLYQFQDKTKYPTVRVFATQPISDVYEAFMQKSFMIDKLCFNELKPFRVVAMNKVCISKCHS